MKQAELHNKESTMTDHIPDGYLEPTSDAINSAIEALFSIQDTLTTMEVRDYLRNKNYWVSCSEVRPYLQCYSSKDGNCIIATKDPVNKYTTYTLPLVSPVSSSGTYSPPVTYRVYSLTTPSKVYSGVGLRRNEARYKYAKEFDIPYVLTSAVRIVTVG